MIVRHRRHGGFTLIELVVVITIIGILAAVALPRFVSMQRDARTAKANGLLGALKSASALAHARCLLDIQAGVAGGCTVAGGVVAMEGLNVDMVNQYPTANATGIIRASQITASSDGVTISAGGAGANQAITIDIIGGTAPNCRITYTTGAAPPTPGAIIAPTIIATTTGC